MASGREAGPLAELIPPQPKPGNVGVAIQIAVCLGVLIVIFLALLPSMEQSAQKDLALPPASPAPLAMLLVLVPIGIMIAFVGIFLYRFPEGPPDGRHL